MSSRHSWSSADDCPPQDKEMLPVPDSQGVVWSRLDRLVIRNPADSKPRVRYSGWWCTISRRLSSSRPTGWTVVYFHAGEPDNSSLISPPRPKSTYISSLSVFHFFVGPSIPIYPPFLQQFLVRKTLQRNNPRSGNKIILIKKGRTATNIEFLSTGEPCWHTQVKLNNFGK